MKRVLLTGAGGFVGNHVLAHLLTETEWEIIATDSFRHKGKTARIKQTLAAGPEEWRERLTVITHDLAAPFCSQLIGEIGHVDYVIAMASESHVDRSIAAPAPFITNNVHVILSTLEYARVARPEMVLVISTDEVYGPIHIREVGEPGWHSAGGKMEPAEPHAEWATILPSNPYSASKAAQEAIAISYWRTFGVPVVITNTMNIIGEMQDPEKFVPRVISHVATGQPVTVHGRPGHIGSRYYLHARNAADALLFIMRSLRPAHQYAGGEQDRPDRYNVVGSERIDNLDLAQRIAAVMGRQLRYELTDFHSTRPGHDPHYGLSGAKLAGLGWKPPVSFDDSLARTVRWTLAHPQWMLP